MQYIPHAFIRKEKNNQIVLVLPYQDGWEDVYFKLKGDHLLISNHNQTWTTHITNPLLLDSLCKRQTQVLIQKDAFFSEGIINPLGSHESTV